MPSILHAFRDGVRRVNAAPAVLAGTWAVNCAIAVQAAVLLGTPRVSLAVDWVQELVVQPTDAPLVSWFRIAPKPEAMAAAFTPVLAWLFLSGGVIDRYARDRATRPHGFFAASGVFFLRFLRLAVVQAIVYVALSRAVESTTALSFLVGACSVVFDYAKVRAVVEDRRSMLGAIAAALGFIRRNLPAAAVLFAIDFVVFRIVATAIGLAGAESAGAVAAVSMVILMWVRLLFWATETALFQSRLAHAGYVARAEPAWPDSPAAEMIT